MKHEEVISKMTMEEKAVFLSGKTVWESRDIKRLGIPSVFCSDGPHGIRKQAGAGDHLGLNASLVATCFPTAATVANSWDMELGKEIGQALGAEARALNVHVLLGPGLNIKRTPLCGRNFEYFSEDPYLSGKMAASYIGGIQEEGIYSCPKHFAVNSQETRRMAVNAVLDERTLREIYLTGFEIAIKEGKAKAIMSSYNEVNGEYANENKHLLQDILRKEWGFDGIVITDWGGSNDHAAGVAAGSNLEMPAPGFDSAREIIQAVEEGKLSTEALDACVDQLLDAVLGLSEQSDIEKKEMDIEAHHLLAKKAAVEGAVLLKNEEHILPLKQTCRVGIIGDFAFEPRYQGAGSSVVNPTKLENIRELAETYFPDFAGCVRGYRRNGEKDDSLQEAAIALAKVSDVVVYCFGLDEISESEGLDRVHMRIPENQIVLLRELTKVNPNIVGVISGGSSIEMPWEDCCKGILHGYLGGQASASAVLELISGKETPSGKLSETYPFCYEDTPAAAYIGDTGRNLEYREGIFAGYRYYDTNQIPVRYPFGYGLSYTTFEYSDIQVDEDGIRFHLKNTGTYDGAEIVQMYVGLPKSRVFRPVKELKGFQKVFLRAGEEKEIFIDFDDKTFRYWNVKTKDWEVESGIYRIQIGASVSDIKLTANISIAGTTDDYPYSGERLPSYYSGQIKAVGDKEYEELLGYKIPDGTWSGELGINDAICQMYYAKSLLARLLYKCMTLLKEKSERKGTPNLNLLFIYNMPFRAIAKMTGGAVSMEMTRGMADMVNGHFFSGIAKVIRGFFKNKKANEEYEKKLRNV